MLEVRLRPFLLALGLFVILPGMASSQTPAPRLFFSDLVSGPSTGGQNNNGAFVTLYGNNFGSNPVVTVGGGQAIVTLGPSAYLWYQKMTIQLGPNAQTGNIVVSNSNVNSNDLPFAVRSGKIYFVATNGSDSHSGSYTSPWKTLVHAVESAGAGSITYAMDGVSQTADDGQGWNAAITLRAEWCQGTATNPKALIAYPGATVTVGNPTGTSPAFGFRSTDSSAGGACGGNWVLAGLVLRGVIPLQTSGPSTNWRIIGNDVSNPQASGGGGAALGVQLSTYSKVLGNNGHDLNLASTNRLQQGFYPGTDSNHLELAWNMIANAHGRAGIQVHSSPLSSGNGYAMYDLSIHDNVVHDIAEEGILVDTVDPSKGPVTVYNNLVYNVGLDGQSDGAIYRADSSDYDTSHGAGAGYVDFYNNTIFAYKAGPGFGATFEVHQGQALIDRLRNNIILSPGGPYFSVANSSTNSACSSTDTASSCPNFTGSNNLLYGAGAPTFTNLVTGSINADPLLVTPAAGDGHLQANSPAIDAGASIPSLATDLDGRLRPQGAGYDIGAYESATGGPVPAVTAVANAASYFLGGVSAGELLACFGLNLGPDAPSSAPPGQSPPTVLGGTQVLFNGIAAQLWYVQANQINVLVPTAAVAGQTAVSLVVDAGGVESAAVPLTVQQTVPGIFALDMSGEGQAIVLNQDGTLNLATNPAPKNSTIQVYATGLGETAAERSGNAGTAGAPLAPVTVAIGGVGSQVLQALGFEGVFEIDALVPGAAPAGPSVPLILTANGLASQATVTVAIQ